MRKRVLTAIITGILVFMISVVAFAHSGRTDSSGGHRDNDNKSGLGYYHYHCGGNPPHLHDGGTCPYSKREVSPSYKKTNVIHTSRAKADETGDTINEDVICVGICIAAVLGVGAFVKKKK